MKRIASWLLVLMLVASAPFGLAETLQEPDISTVDLSSDEEVAAFVAQIIGDQIGENEEIANVVMDGVVLTIEIDISKTDLMDGVFTYADIAETRAVSITDAILEYPELDERWQFIIVDAGEGGNVIFTHDDIVDSDYGRYFEGGEWNTY